MFRPLLKLFSYLIVVFSPFATYKDEKTVLVHTAQCKFWRPFVCSQIPLFFSKAKLQSHSSHVKYSLHNFKKQISHQGLHTYPVFEGKLRATRNVFV